MNVDFICFKQVSVEMFEGFDPFPVEHWVPCGELPFKHTFWKTPHGSYIKHSIGIKSGPVFDIINENEIYDLVIVLIYKRRNYLKLSCTP